MNRLFLSLLLSGLAAASAKADNADALVVAFHSGSTQTYALADSPKLSTQNGLLTIVCKGETLQASLGDVANCHFVAAATAIIQPTASKAAYSEGRVVIGNETAGSTVVVASLNGTRVAEAKVGSDGQATVDLTRLPQGVYIVKSLHTSMKIIRK